jgi:ribosomal protein S11
MDTAYKGKHKRLFSITKDNRVTTIHVYLNDNNTLVIKTDDDGQSEISLEPS